MGTGTLNLNILKTEAQTDPIIELTDSGANGGVIFSGVTTFNDSATFNSAVNFVDSSISLSSLAAYGSADSTTFLRGDGNWAVATPSTAVGGVGSYMRAFIAQNGTSTLNGTLYTTPGATLNGSDLRYNPTIVFSEYGNQAVVRSYVQHLITPTYPGGGTALSGTWQVMENVAWFHAYNRGTTYNESGDQSCEWMTVLVVRVS